MHFRYYIEWLPTETNNKLKTKPLFYIKTKKYIYTYMTDA